MQYYQEQYDKLQRDMRTAQLPSTNFNLAGGDDDVMLDSFVSAVSLSESTLKEVK